ncbi:biopolymer transporter ExbD [Sedimentitalea sp. JM2-8]|uniref:Biopolymer transporter ExbD n=1 Tax=Sedimentitalea xiamensis TaxID=3050037 RepID=A0ABT7FH90_9RHOB|nr:biopolymer transporter ExbD [Sedimentitalea xiamensis]MDK3074457.1 biopolymer transporter ExbD [Sedimentitalea xiamensis]
MPRRRRKPSLTPMIDVVFLLLVFFMLASRFGLDQVLPLPMAGSGGAYDGPPRLIDIAPDGLFVNGAPTDETTLNATVGALMQAPSDMLILRGRDGADLQRIIAIADRLRAAGFTSLVLVE